MWMFLVDGQAHGGIVREIGEAPRERTTDGSC
jgi:hypothetical protein